MPGCKRTTGVVSVYSDYENLSKGVAELFVRLADEAIRDRGRFNVALSGGHTPKRAYELLASQDFREQVDWSNVHVFWGDERCVPPDDPRSNFRMASQTFLDHVPIPRKQIHPVLCVDSAKDAAWSYELLLRSLFENVATCFDLVLLGLGLDGHTASLFPGTPAVNEKTRWVTEIASEKEGIHRVTLTVPVINRSAMVVFVVSGVSKGKVLNEVLCKQPEPERIPASLIKPESGGKLYWLVEKEAASLLEAEQAIDEL